MMENEYLKNKTVKNHPEGNDRKPYVKPQLTEYGKIEKLTQSGGTKRNDTGPRSRG